MHLLGPPRVMLHSRPIKMERQKSLALLTYLAVTGQLHTRATLATLFWPETRQARTYLRKSIAELRQFLPGEWLENDAQMIGFRSAAPLWVDAFHFAQCVDLGLANTDAPLTAVEITNLAAAVDLYQGDFLTGFTLPDAPDFDDWVRLESDRLRRLAEAALDHLIDHWRQHGDYAQAIAYAQRRLAMDATVEAVHRQLM